MSKIRLGIIGMGNMGTGHARNIYEGRIPEIELTAVADINPERLDWAKENLFPKVSNEIKLFATAEEMMKSGACDAVLIAVPHYFHPQYAIEAAKLGLHVMCEKPAGVYTKQVREMNETVAGTDVVFGMMFNQRTNPMYRKMHELVNSGQYGQIKRVSWIVTDWYRTQTYYDSGAWRATWAGEGGGVLLNQCPHNLDLLQWICGMPSKIQAFLHEGKWHDIEVEDDVTAYLEYPNGATGIFVTTTGDYPGTNRFEVTLECAKLVCENDKLIVTELLQNEREYCKIATEGFVGPGTKPAFEPELSGENNQHVGIMNAFTDKILGKGELIANGAEGINGLTLSNAMHLSSWTNTPVTLPFDEELFLTELNKRRATSRHKDVASKVFDTEGTY